MHGGEKSWLKASSRVGSKKPRGRFCYRNVLQSPAHSYKYGKCIEACCKAHFIVYVLWGRISCRSV
jgi:hypothetical protein